MIVEKFWVLCFFSADFLLCDLLWKWRDAFFSAPTANLCRKSTSDSKWECECEIHRRYRFENSYEASSGFPLYAGRYTYTYTRTGRTVCPLLYKSQFNLHSFFVRSEGSLPPLECYPIEKDLKQYKLNSCSFFCATWVTIRDRFRCACSVLSSGALKMRRWIADFKIYLVLGRLWALAAATISKKMTRFLLFIVCFIRLAMVATTAVRTLFPLSSRDYLNLIDLVTTSRMKAIILNVDLRHNRRRLGDVCAETHRIGTQKIHRDFQIKAKLIQCRGLSTRSALGIHTREIQKTRHIDFLNSPTPCIP